MASPFQKDGGGLALCPYDAELDALLARASADEREHIAAAQRDLRATALDHRLQFDANHAYPVCLRPTLIDADWAAELKLAGERFIRVFDDVLELYRHDDEVRGLYRGYEPVRDYLLAAPGFRPLTRICRFDGLVAPDGRYLILETNTDCPANLFASGMATRLWRSRPNPILAAWGRDVEWVPQPIVETRNLFISEMLDTYRADKGREPSEVRIVNYNGRFTSETDLIIQGFDERGIHCEFIDLRELAPGAGHVTHRGTRIDLVYNKWDLRDLVRCPDAAPYLRAVADGDVVSVNPLACQWLYADKSILALLSDPRFCDHFSPADRQLFQRHVPWTRVVAPGRSISMEGDAVDLCDYLQRNRSRFLLKPTNATWGDGIVIGNKAREEDWRRAVETAASDASYVAQEYIQGHVVHCPDPTTGEITQRIADLNMFIFGGKAVGFLSRANQSPIMSLYKGGAMLPVLVARHPAS
ncbi:MULTISPECIES: hypothetical protein [unclassified Myxococcus]|uniref:hypothetical protein n=1 Tax=unclassified Myxococcus TaxID=2648731 RepID=UPI001CBFD0E0|nr:MULTISPECIES: hypothetical protein [unclassified Myxococcus]MBZ4401577.1 hypothetical protein [Myxococcus sp. AS-1-15]MBZ4412582.1 hypothetical protein [Myxococcus sp. XM-1-1-1]